MRKILKDFNWNVYTPRLNKKLFIQLTCCHMTTLVGNGLKTKKSLLLSYLYLIHPISFIYIIKSTFKFNKIKSLKEYFSEQKINSIHT